MFSAAPIHAAVFFITHNPREIEEYYKHWTDEMRMRLGWLLAQLTLDLRGWSFDVTVPAKRVGSEYVIHKAINWCSADELIKEHMFQNLRIYGA